MCEKPCARVPCFVARKFRVYRVLRRGRHNRKSLDGANSIHTIVYMNIYRACVCVNRNPLGRTTYCGLYRVLHVYARAGWWWGYIWVHKRTHTHTQSHISMVRRCECECENSTATPPIHRNTAHNVYKLKLPRDDQTMGDDPLVSVCVRVYVRRAKTCASHSISHVIRYRTPRGGRDHISGGDKRTWL